MAASRWRIGRRCQMLLFVTAVCLLPAILQGHGHAHDDHHGHAHDEPAFKYSREANEADEPPRRADNHAHSHGHGHAHDHGHGHAHDHGHGHAHAHGHSHDHGHGHAHQGHSHTKPGETKKGIEEFERGPKREEGPGWDVWFKALAATAFISISPVFILYFVPLNNADEQKDRLKILLSFASGGLLGDAFLHLIPHSISPHNHGEEGDHGHSHSHGHSHESHGHSHEHHSHDMGVGLWVLGGIVAFLMVEKFVRFVKEGSGEHGHGHSHASPKKQKTETEEKKKTEEAKGKPDEKKTESPKKPKKAKDSDEEVEDQEEEDAEEKDKKSEKEDKKKTSEKEGEEKGDAKDKKGEADSSVKEAEHMHGSDIKVAGYLNLAADFAHNFTDGLAIGASFLGGNTLGMITTVTIFLHEIPHEIGDFAILVQSGCTKKKAMMLQFSTAIGAMLGTLCSLLAGGVGMAATAWILPFTAGGFIYIATVSVIPELLEEAKIKQSMMEIAALLVGVYMMVLIAEYE